ncbi:hypothetical protein KDL44_15005 [bacterium]|nr:hypothetical protein [bacterium]
MKRLTCLVGFTIVILAMPLAAWAGGSGEAASGQRQEQRVEIRVEREGRGGGRDRQRDSDRRGDDGKRGAGWNGESKGEDGWRGGMQRWMERGMRGGGGMDMPGHAGRMFRGIRGQAMRINFHPDITQSAVATGMNNKAVQADTININISIGDVNIAGNSMEGTEAGEMLEMIMELMMKSHGKDGPAGHPGMWSQDGPGMHGGPGGPGMYHGPGGVPGKPDPHHGDGNNGPGHWQEHIDRNHPPQPGLPEAAGVMDRARFIGRDDEGRIVQYEMLLRGDEAPVEPGEVRSPYHDYYFGSGRMPELLMDRSRNEHILQGEPMHPHSAQQEAHGMLPRFDEGIAPQHAFWPPLDSGFEGQFDLRPDVIELAMQIPDDVPLEFVEMIFRLGRMAWEDQELRAQLEALVAADEVDQHVDKQEIRRVIEHKLRSAQQD